MAKTSALCAVAPNCIRLGDFCRGFCSTHYGEFMRHCTENGSLTREKRDVELKRVHESIPKPVAPKWEYEGHEDELIAMVEEQERETASKVDF